MELGGLKQLEKLLDHRKPAIRREAIWAASNILADGPELIEKTIDTSVFVKLLNAIIMDIDNVNPL